MKYDKIKVFILLHILLAVYSISGIFSKYAAMQTLLSVKFFACYAVIISLLGIYAVVWQQIIKRIPLTIAFANKSVTIVWGLIWGFLFFYEEVTIGKLLGIALVVIGVILFMKEDMVTDDE